MRKQNLLTRDQAITKIGIEAVETVEEMHADFTNRVMGDEEVEFSSSHNLIEQENDIDGITVYYYQDKKLFDELDEESFELSDLTWEVAGYEIY